MAKSLQTRSKTIRKAIQAYNTAAASLEPPRPALAWSDVSHYGLVEHYAILKANNTDISNKEWSQPIYCEVLKCRRCIARAKEELTRCNVEVRRLHTGIIDDAIHFKNVVRKLKEEASPSYEAVKSFAKRRNVTHRALLKRIRKIYALPGFTGDPSPGVCIERDGTASVFPDDDDADETNGNDLLNNREDEGEDEDEEAAESDDEAKHEVEGIETFMCTTRD